MLSLHKECPYSELFWSISSCIRAEHGEIRSIQSECGKIWTRIIPNIDTFLTVYISTISEAYSESCQTSKMELFCEIVDEFQLLTMLTIFAKGSIQNA